MKRVFAFLLAALLVSPLICQAGGSYHHCDYQCQQAAKQAGAIRRAFEATVKDTAFRSFRIAPPAKLPKSLDLSSLFLLEKQAAVMQINRAVVARAYDQIYEKEDCWRNQDKCEPILAKLHQIDGWYDIKTAQIDSELRQLKGQAPEEGVDYSSEILRRRMNVATDFLRSCTQGLQAQTSVLPEAQCRVYGISMEPGATLADAQIASKVFDTAFRKTYDRIAVR